MSFVLTENKCKSCGLKLTMFEITEKDGKCIDCYKEDNKK